MKFRFTLVLALTGAAAAALAVPKTPVRRKSTSSPSPSTTPSPAATPTPAMSASCNSPQYRQFDFWLGEWDFVGTDGKKSTDDRVVPVLAGCALQENWTSVKSGQGLSFSAYDPATKRWHQTLMDDSGAVLKLEGELADGKMVLVGQRPSQKEKGVTITHRLVWTPLPDHRVKQYWELSTNGGRTWRPVSEGYYVPKK